MVLRFSLAAMLGFFSSCQITAAERSCGDEPILAMSYNIRLDTKTDGANAWDGRKRFFINQVATLRPDILGLQEVLLNQKHDLERAFPGYDFVGVGRDDGKEGGEFSPLAISRQHFKVKAQGTFWLSPTPDRPSLGWDAGYKRVVSWARLSRRRDGAPILAINTHWDHQGQVARAKSSDLVRNWIARNQQKGEHLVLLGDFNADESEASVGQLTQPLPHGETLANSRAKSLSGTSGPAISYNAFNAFPESGKLIDHIFVSPGFVVKAHAIVAAHENGRVASDHFPVVALLGLPGRRAQHCAP